jgi:hypothetical protein
VVFGSHKIKNNLSPKVIFEIDDANDMQTTYAEHTRQELMRTLSVRVRN